MANSDGTETCKSLLCVFEIFMVVIIQTAPCITTLIVPVKVYNLMFIFLLYFPTTINLQHFLMGLSMGYLIYGRLIHGVSYIRRGGGGGGLIIRTTFGVSNIYCTSPVKL